MRAIKLSEKHARTLVRAIEHGDIAVNTGGAFDALKAALQPHPKSSQVKKREARNRAKAAQTRDIYAEVEKRAGERCEACGILFAAFGRGPELDHAAGRGKAKQSVENCWLICRRCHYERTNSIPSQAYWLNAFIRHATKHGYKAEATRADNRLYAIETTRGGR